MEDSELYLVLTIAVVLIGVLTVNVLRNIMTSVEEIKEKPEPCRLHDWYEMINEKDENLGLVCAKCGKTPKLEERGFEE